VRAILDLLSFFRTRTISYIVEPIKLEIENLAVNKRNSNLSRTGKAVRSFATALRYEQK
jgi:hypothetical protein